MAQDVKPLSLKANMLWNSAGSMFYLVCQWLITVLVVRLSSGFDSAGLLSLATSVVGTFGTFANYKIGTYQISDIHREYSFNEYMGFRCLTLGIAFVACLLYSFATCPLYSIVTIVLYYVYKGVGLVIDICHGEDQLNRRMDYIGKSFILQGLVSIISFIAVFVLIGDLNVAIIAMVVGVVCVLLLFDLRHTSRFTKIGIGIGTKRALHLLRTSLPAVVASVAASAIFTVPKQYLLSVAGDSALGIYSSIAAPALVIQMGAQYLYGPLLDVFPRRFFDGKMSEFNRLLARTVLSIIVVGVICCVGLLFLGEHLLVIVFGEQIRAYVYLLQPVLISTLATAFLWFFGDLLITIRDFRANFFGNVLALVVVVPLSVLLVNAYGMNGVSFAGAGACLVGVAYLEFALARDSKKQLAAEEADHAE